MCKTKPDDTEVELWAHFTQVVAGFMCAGYERSRLQRDRASNILVASSASFQTGTPVFVSDLSICRSIEYARPSNVDPGKVSVPP